MPGRTRPRKAGDFTNSISYSEWIWLTRWWPLIVGAVAGLTGLGLGLLVGGLT